jgi:hypothetical protein
MTSHIRVSDADNQFTTIHAFSENSCPQHLLLHLLRFRANVRPVINRPPRTTEAISLPYTNGYVLSISRVETKLSGVELIMMI